MPLIYFIKIIITLKKDRGIVNVQSSNSMWRVYSLRPPSPPSGSHIQIKSMLWFCIQTLWSVWTEEVELRTMDYNPCIQRKPHGRQELNEREVIAESLVFRIQMGSIYCVILTFWVNTALAIRSGVNVGGVEGLSLYIYTIYQLIYP